MSKYSRLRGTQDIFPPDIGAWQFVESVFADVFTRFAYREIRTPIIEPTDLFTRAVGEQSDIVTKEMYTFEDRGGRSVTLRPENTASVARAYLENGLHRRGGLQRLFYMGPMFRYDRPQKGRYRQFHQIGAEAIGGDAPAIDVELIHMVVLGLRQLGFDQLELRINSVGTPSSREPYRKKLLAAMESLSDELEDGWRERYGKNPLRIFDSKEIGAIKDKLPTITEHLDADDREHFDEVKRLLAALEVPFVEDPHLVRGLDYYTRTAFEFYSGDRGAQSALCGGGRYDNLIEECGGPATPAIGFSIGLERVVANLPEGSAAGAAAEEIVDVYVGCVSPGDAGLAMKAAGVAREMGVAEVDLSGRSQKKQIQVGERKRARAIIIATNGELQVRVRGEKDTRELTLDGLGQLLADVWDN